MDFKTSFSPAYFDLHKEHIMLPGRVENLHLFRTGNEVRIGSVVTML